MKNSNDTNIMDGEIPDLIDGITDQLARMSKKERIAWFKRTIYPQPLNFINEIDGTQYIVRTFFDGTATESIEEKVKRITSKA